LWQKSKYGFLIYPNPTDKQTVIKDINPEAFRFAVYSIGGKTMTSEIAAKKIFYLNTSGWPNGMYVLKIQSGNKIVVKKLIVSH
jgi:hypothetical protein